MYTYAHLNLSNFHSKKTSIIEATTLNLKPQLRTWNPSSKLETAQNLKPQRRNVVPGDDLSSNIQCLQTTQSKNLTLTRKHDQKNQNTSSITTIFVVLGLVKKRVNFSLFDPCYVLIWNKMVLD